MRITIRRVFDVDDRVLVEFSCSAGGAVGAWLSGGVSPGQELDVELDFEDRLRMGRNAAAASVGEFRLRQHGEQAVLEGMVESLDDDGLLYFRLGDDCLMMVDSAPGEFSIGDWIRIHCAGEKLGLTAIGQ